MKKNYGKAALLLLFAVIHLSLTAQKFKPLFNGKNLKGWNTFLNKRGKNNDPDSVFSVKDGLLRVSGKELGYVITKKEYTNFHLVVEFRWGAIKWPPRENRSRDNGILYYVAPVDKVWPPSIECQIQEGDCGDLWLVDSTTAVVDGVLRGPGPSVRVVKKKDGEKSYGEWNRVEVIARDGKCTHIVNGVVVSEAEQLSRRTGRILIQSELAEIYYRKIEITKL